MTSNLLSADDIRFFKRKGYLIKRGVLDHDLMARARDALWEAASPPLDRNDPDTWVGPFEVRNDETNYMGEYAWKYRERGGEDWMIRLLATDPTIWSMAEQFLGAGTLRQPDRIRGIYCTFPEGDKPAKTPTCHCDGHPFHVGVVGYIDKVLPDGGGLKVWPGSHLRFYYDFDSRYRTEENERSRKDYDYFNTQPYVDFHGEAGDIIFWHHRLAHAGAYNRTRQIRQAVFYDFCKDDIDEKLDAPPAENMWEDWSEEVRSID